MSIPRKNLGPGRERIIAYENCLQYDINFKEVYPEDQPGLWPIKANESWPTVYCKNGWEYDRSEYENSLVTEVSLQIHSLHNKNTICVEGKLSEATKFHNRFH